MITPAMALTMAAWMVAMMLPSIAPTLWAYHGHLRAVRVAHPSRRTTFFALGYAGVWSAISVTLTTITALPAFCMAHPAPWVAGAVVLSAGVVQCSPWKARRLLRCRREWATVEATPSSIMAAWHRGFQFGVDCALSCAGPMAVLCVAGLMDVRMMVAITLAITAERVAPAGPHIARLTGLAAVIVGSAMCLSVL
jgi:predicted metal-binding membrane protein